MTEENEMGKMGRRQKAQEQLGEKSILGGQESAASCPAAGSRVMASPIPLRCPPGRLR